MDHDLTSGQMAEMLASMGVRLSAATIQRYARSGRIPSKTTPGGRYRYNFDEVLRSLSSPSAEQSLTRPVLAGGLGEGRPAVDSDSSTLSRAVSAHVSEASPGHEGRFARASHPDAVEEHVLRPCGNRITGLAKNARANPSGRSRAQMLVLMADEWYLAPGEQLIALQLIVTEAGAQSVGLWDGARSAFDEAGIERARKELQSDLSRRITPGLGYSLTIEVHTLDRVSAETYRTWSPWTWDSTSSWPVEATGQD